MGTTLNNDKADMGTRLNNDKVDMGTRLVNDKTDMGTRLSNDKADMGTRLSESWCRDDVVEESKSEGGTRILITSMTNQLLHGIILTGDHSGGMVRSPESH